MGGDRRYLGLFWVAVVGLTWAGYAFSSFRQRRQTGQLRALANRWLDAGPPGSQGATTEPERTGRDAGGGRVGGA